MDRVSKLLFTYLYGLICLVGDAFVLCQGADGHKTIKTVHVSHCATLHSEHHDVSNLPELSDPCLPCVDIPFRNDDHVSCKIQAKPSQTLFSSIDLIKVKYFKDAFTHKICQLAIPPPRPNTTLEALSTVILLL